jgi:FtsP/CotA-like multicopper oxidase with cupredoxin domain
MPLEPKWYRFRFLNTAVARPFLIKFKSDFGRDIGPDICRVIASEGGYRGDAIIFPREGLQIGVAERYEVVCDFTAYAGRQLYIW